MTKETRPRRASTRRRPQAVLPSPLDWVRVELLDPKSIGWLEGSITSEYDLVGVVQLEDGNYEGVAGKNRCIVALETGSAQVLCVVRQGSHQDVIKAYTLASPERISNYERLEDEYDLEALKYAASLVLTSATPDPEAPGSSSVSDDALARLRDALRDPYIPDL